MEIVVLDGFEGPSVLWPQDPSRVCDVLQHGPDTAEFAVIGPACEMFRVVSIGKIDPTNDGADPRRRVGDTQHVFGFLDAGRGLHENCGVDAVRG